MRPLFAFYGDDFTGSTDVMEVLQWSGVRTVLFMSTPTPEQLAQFDDLRGLGIAGASRSMSIEQMQATLPDIFAALQQSGAAFVHYKTCSTFDSAPHIGSIGKAIELGRDCFGSHTVPVIVGVPRLGRYQVFGNLFAKSGVERELYRLDRHPTMAQHPVTPMHESDLRRVLAAQTDLAVELVDVLDMDHADAVGLARRIEAGPAAIALIDVLTEEHVAVAGDLLNALADHHAPRFVAGSSGVVAALTHLWREQGQATALDPLPTFGAARQYWSSPAVARRSPPGRSMTLNRKAFS